MEMININSNIATECNTLHQLIDFLFSRGFVWHSDDDQYDTLKLISRALRNHDTVYWAYCPYASAVYGDWELLWDVDREVLEKTARNLDIEADASPRRKVDVLPTLAKTWQ